MKWVVVIFAIIAMVVYQGLMLFHVPTPIVTLTNISSMYKVDPKLSKPRIAIVGGGIAGTSNSYYLRDFLGNNVQISLFEKSDRLGGRTHSAYTQDGTRFDVGGTSIIIENYYALQLVKKFNLTFAPPMGALEKMILWNAKSKSIVYEESENNLITQIKTLAKYNLEIFWAKKKIRQVMNRFLKIYDLQNNATTFEKVSQLVESLGFEQEVTSTFEEYITSNHLTQQNFWREILITILGVNYNQNSSTSAFASLISSAAIISSFHTLQQGTDALSRNLKEHSNPNHVFLNTKVKRIEKVSNGKFKLSFETCDGSCRSIEDIFDTVVLGTPFELSGIQFVNIPVPSPRSFVNVKVTFVVGLLDPTAFGLQESSRYYSVLTTQQDSTFGWFKISPCGMTKTLPIYKIFSKKEIPDDFIKKHFSKFEQVYHYNFDAYPFLHPVNSTQWHDFKVMDGLYQVNAMESIVSTLETELISSRNIALMILKNYAKK